MAVNSHVPKFGNWENDNIPYTAYFENARKDKTGMMIINPNDPQENPEAFLHREGKMELSFGHQPIEISTTTPLQESTSDPPKGFASESATASASNKSFSGYSLLQAGFRRQNSAQKHKRAASIPKFGAWDEADPNSGEGFTVIFSRVKEEKKIASSTFPSLQPKSTYLSHTRTNKPTSSSTRKFCCCIFWCGRRH